MFYLSPSYNMTEKREQHINIILRFVVSLGAVLRWRVYQNISSFVRHESVLNVWALIHVVSTYLLWNLKTGSVTVVRARCRYVQCIAPFPFHTRAVPTSSAHSTGTVDTVFMFLCWEDRGFLLTLVNVLWIEWWEVISAKIEPLSFLCL